MADDSSTAKPPSLFDIVLPVYRCVPCEACVDVRILFLHVVHGQTLWQVGDGASGLVLAAVLSGYPACLRCVMEVGLNCQVSPAVLMQAACASAAVFQAGAGCREDYAFLAGELQKILDLPNIAPMAPKRVWIYVKVGCRTWSTHPFRMLYHSILATSLLSFARLSWHRSLAPLHAAISAQDEDPAAVERAKQAFPFAHHVEQIANLGRESYVR